MEARNQVDALAEMLRKCPPLQITLSTLGLGMTFLHVRSGERCFVLAYYPKENGFGVDEVLDDEGFEMGYKHWFEDFALAKEKLLSMLREAE